MDADSQRPSSTPDDRLSLILPAWNEEAVIARAVQEATEALARTTVDFEVIVVDDGSTDATADIVTALGKSDPRVRLVKQPENCGYGAALRAGFAAARFDLVAFTDADCQFELDDLAYMLPLARQYDIVSGYRLDRKDSALRRFCSWGYNTLIQLLLGSTQRDIDCALKIFHRDQLPRIAAKSNHYFANTEMSTNARRRGLSTVEVGVRHRPRAAGYSKVSPLEVPKTLSDLLPYWWQNILFAAEPQRSDTVAKPTAANAHFWPALLLLLIVASALLFPNLSYPLIEPDEGRYAEIPREMLATGDWIVPRFHGEPYLDKPPLFYWMCAASYSVFGAHDWAARLVPAAAALLTILMTFVFGTRLLGTRVAFLGTTVLTLSLGFLYCSRFLVLDGVLTLFVAASLFAAHLAFAEERWNGRWWIASAVACGLGVMTKGPVALVLLMPPVAAHAWLSGSRNPLTLKRWCLYGAIIFAVAAPWFALLMSQQPEFVRYFFWEHNVNRFLAGSFHPQPIWYFVPVAFLGCMPWGLLLFPLCRFLFRRTAHHRAMRPLPLGYLLLWSLWCVLFFSLSRGKLPPYILPAAPAVCLMLGCLIDRTCSPFAARVEELAQSRRTFQMGTLLLCASGGMMGVVAGSMNLIDWEHGLVELVAWSTALGLVWFNRHRFSPRLLWIGFCTGAFLFAMDSSQELFPAWAEQHQMIAGGESVERRLHDEQTPVACIGGRWGSVPFYLNRNVALITDLHCPEFEALLNAEGDAICYVNDRYTFEEIRQAMPEGAICEKLAETSKATIVRVDGPALKPMAKADDESDAIDALTSAILQVVAEIPRDWAKHR